MKTYVVIPGTRCKTFVTDSELSPVRSGEQRRFKVSVNPEVFDFHDLELVDCATGIPFGSNGTQTLHLEAKVIETFDGVNEEIYTVELVNNTPVTVDCIILVFAKVEL